ncbi:MAG TPA: hypothetical protein V6D07_03885 [Trichocoleus sp.]
MIKPLGSIPFIALALLLLSLTSCLSPPDTSTRELSDNAAAEPQIRSTWRGRVLENPEEGVQVRLPRDWQVSPSGTLNQNAELYAYNPRKQIYLVVVGENSSSLGYNSLQDNARAYRQLLSSRLGGTTQQEPTQLTALGAYPAEQYLVRGSVEGTPVAYLHTTVAAKDKYYQVVTWTTEQLYNENRSEMQDVIASFEEG